jgi:hypothetical protein
LAAGKLTIWKSMVCKVDLKNPCWLTGG